MHNLFRDLLRAEIPEDQEILFRMKKLCRISHDLFMSCRKDVRPGITTERLACCFETELSTREKGRIAICHIHINVNEQAFHCLPGYRLIRPGDILTVDLVLSDGVVFSDGAWTYAVGEISPQRKALLEQAWLTSCAAAGAVKAGDSYRKMQKTVETSLSGSQFSLVREACGHGLGLEIHDDPEIPFFTSPASGAVWEEKTLCTIEPVIVRGNPSVRDLEGKGFFTEEGSDAAYFEHVILVEAWGASCLNIPEINVKECIDIFQGFN